MAFYLTTVDLTTGQPANILMVPLKGDSNISIAPYTVIALSTVIVFSTSATAKSLTIAIVGIARTIWKAI